MANVRSLPSLGAWQPSLLDAGESEPRIDASFSAARRITLEPGAWIEHVPSWAGGASALFTHIVEHAPWSHRTVRMYDRMVEEPRLTAWWDTAAPPELPGVVPEMAAALSARYDREFASVGAALYRDGRDSVAWHGDRISLEIVEPVVALVSLGSLRVLRMRRKAEHRDTRAFPLAPGDLFVMGGTSQRTWEHSIPKVARSGPRLSLQFRHG